MIYIFAYVFVQVTVCICVRIGCAPQLHCRNLLRHRRPAVSVFRPCWPVFTCLLSYDEKSRDRGARFLDTFKVRRCWIKIDSSVNLGATPSLEFLQCVLWVIRLTKTVESICCAVRHAVTVLRAVWRTIRSPHSVRVLSATTTDAGRHRPSAARPPTPAVRSVGVVYYAVVTTRLLLSACCYPLVTSFWWHSCFYIMLQTPFFILCLLIFP